MAGFFVVLEGVDGCGSTTQAALLNQELCSRGVDTLLTAEPSSGFIGATLRGLLKKKSNLAGLGGPLEGAFPSWSTFALLFAADRLHHLDSQILPALERGAVVICDRYLLSSLVYQSTTSPEGIRAIPWLRAINSWARSPDITLIIDIPDEEAAARRSARGGEAELFEEETLQRQISAVYRRANDLLPERVAVVSGLGTPTEVNSRILELILPTVLGIRSRTGSVSSTETPPGLKSSGGKI